MVVVEVVVEVVLEVVEVVVVVVVDVRPNMNVSPLSPNRSSLR